MIGLRRRQDLGRERGRLRRPGQPGRPRRRPHRRHRRRHPEDHRQLLAAAASPSAPSWSSSTTTCVNGRGAAAATGARDPRRDPVPTRRSGHRRRAPGGPGPGVTLKPAPFAFVRPQGLQHALEALAADPGAKVLAGGQSLVPLLNMRLAGAVHAGRHQRAARARPRARRRRRRPGRRAGAARRRARLARRTPGAAAADAGPGARRARHDPQPRHGRRVPRARRRRRPSCRPCSALLGGSVTRGSTRGGREIAAADLFVGPLESTVAHDEIAVEAFFPALAPGAGVALRGDRPPTRRLRALRRRRRRARRR